MLSMSLKKCVFRTQIRQFVTFYRRNRASVKDRPLNYCVESKYTNVTSPNLVAHRLLNTNPSEGNQKYRLQPLMRLPDAFPHFVPISLFISYWRVRLSIDKDFRLGEVCRGAKQAIILTADALATQNYEVLEGVVKERSLKVLKHRANRLTPDQRKKIGGTRVGMTCFPENIVIRQCKERNEKLVEVRINGFLFVEIAKYAELNDNVSFFCYTFQRKYIDSIGNSWVIKIANHFA